MAAKRRQTGTAIPAGVNIGKNTFTRNSARSFAAVQREHASRAVAHLARGVELRRLIRARARS